MVTYYVLYDTFLRTFVRAGRVGGECYNLSQAKHFTSKWSAENYRENHEEFIRFDVKKIVRY